MSTPDIAVIANHVSKTYRLWHSPKHRLIFLVKKLWKKNIASNYYREFYALDNTSVEIKKGESWGFIGVNGSGKSTLLKIISGKLRPSSGFVEVNGKVATLDYSNGFHGDFTGKENIYIKATLLGLTRKQIRERYHAILEFAELGHFIDQPIKTYSSGMVARLGFAIMAQVDADIIISDEALAVGDIFFVQKCMRFVQNFLKKGTFLFVSHSTHDVVSLCQNAVWLEHGKMKAMGPSKIVAEAYLNKNKYGTLITKSNSGNEHTTENNNALVVLGTPHPAYKKLNTLKDGRAHHLRDRIPLSHFKRSNIAKANILKINLFDEKGKPLTQMIGCELAFLSIKILAKQQLKAPIIGFQLYDRLGQIIIADFTQYEESFTLDADSIYNIKWTIQLPLLPPGDYVIGGIIAEKQAETINILDLINPALVIHSVTTSPRHSIAGIPMLSIKLKCVSVNHNQDVN